MYTFRNIRLMMKNSTAAFVILTAALAVSFAVLYFSIGVLYQYSRSLDDGEVELFWVSSSLKENGEPITKAEMVRFTELIPDDLRRYIDRFETSAVTEAEGIDEPVQIGFLFEYADGGFGYSSSYYDPMIERLVVMNGRFFTQEEYRIGADVALVMGKSRMSGGIGSVPVPKQQEGTFTAFGKKYEIIGVIDPDNNSGNIIGSSFLVPFGSLPDDTELSSFISIKLDRRITRSEYDRFSALMNKCFGDRIEVSPPLTDLRSNKSYYTLVIIAALVIALLSALNISVIYNYLILTRRRQIYIFRLCGGVRWRLSFSVANEVAVIMLPCALIAAAVYHLGILPLLEKHFPLIGEAYSLAVYAALIGVYMLITYIINYAVYFCRSSADVRR